MDLTDEQWSLLEPLIPLSPRRADGRGRPWRAARDVLNGILWVLRTGAPWHDLPAPYPSYQTCHRRFQKWVRDDTLGRLLRAFVRYRERLGDLNLQECFVDGSFAPAKMGGACVGKTKRGKGTKLMAIAEGHSLPVAIDIASASPHEVTLVDDLLLGRASIAPPTLLIGDKAYDSDALDARLAKQGITVIAPHRANRRRRTQDGRRLRRYRRRWKIERLWAWLFNFRRLVVRYERFDSNFRGFLYLACILILIRGL